MMKYKDFFSYLLNEGFYLEKYDGWLSKEGKYIHDIRPNSHQEEVLKNPGKYSLSKKISTDEVNPWMFSHGWLRVGYIYCDTMDEIDVEGPTMTSKQKEILEDLHFSSKKDIVWDKGARSVTLFKKDKFEEVITSPHGTDPRELAMGLTLEMENTDSEEDAHAIVLKNLKKNPKHYSDLKKSGCKELNDISPSSGFGDPDNSINKPQRHGHDVTPSAGNNIVGSIDGTPPLEGTDGKSSGKEERTWESIQNEYERKYGNNHHHLRLECSKCGNSQTCRCTAAKIKEIGICPECYDKLKGNPEGDYTGEIGLLGHRSAKKVTPALTGKFEESHDEEADDQNRWEKIGTSIVTEPTKLSVEELKKLVDEASKLSHVTPEKIIRFLKYVWRSRDQHTGNMQISDPRAIGMIKALDKVGLMIYAGHSNDHRLTSRGDRAAGLLKEMAQISKSGSTVMADEVPLKSLSVESVDGNVVFFRVAEAGMVAAGFTLVYFMDSDQSAKDIKEGRIPYLMVPRGTFMSGGSPITDIWKKKFQKPGTEHILGVLEGNSDKENIFVDMITVRPGWQRNSIASKMLDIIKKEFPKAKVSTSSRTEKGEKFFKSTVDKNISEGGSKMLGLGRSSDQGKARWYIDAYDVDNDKKNLHATPDLTTGKKRKTDNVRRENIQKMVEDMSYEGNIGFEEVVKFMGSATKEQKDEFTRLLDANKLKEAWELVMMVTKTKLK